MFGRETLPGQEHDRVVITRNGTPAAVLISPDDLDSLEEARLACRATGVRIGNRRSPLIAGRLDETSREVSGRVGRGPERYHRFPGGRAGSAGRAESASSTSQP